MLVTGEWEIGERERCDGEGIGGRYFEPGEELWGILAFEKLPRVVNGMSVLLLLCFGF